MKVLFIDVNCKQSSTGKIVYDLYTEYQKEGHEAAICYGRGKLINEPNVFKFGLDVETYFHALMTRLTGLTGCYSFFSTYRLLKFMDDFKPDVVHIHELHAYFVNVAPVINYLKKYNIKTVWTFHCEFMYTGKCGSALECERWKNECGSCPQLRVYPSSWLFDFTEKMLNDKRRLFEGYDNLTIVTPSKWLADRVRQSFLANKDICVIHNGMDTQKIFYPRPFEHLKEKHNIKSEKIILHVTAGFNTSDNDIKGGRFVVELAERLINDSVKIIVVGTSDGKINLPENVIHVGRINNQEELAAYYSMADLCLLTSKAETFSMVCAESLSCGTPICGFDAGAPKEVAPEGYAIFVPYGNITELEKSIRLVLNNRTIFRSSIDCMNFAREKYDKAVLINRYIDIYKPVDIGNRCKTLIERPKK